MKKLKIIGIIVVVLLLAYCGKKLTQPEIDVVTGRKPVSSNEWRNELVHKFQLAKTNKERDAIMKENGSILTAQLVDFLHSRNYTCPIDTVLYRYGTGTAKGVTSGDGHKYDGKFSPQPYAVVKGGNCFKDSMFVFILCFNGTFTLTSGDAVPINGGYQVFTIQQGQGINRYVDFKTSIRLAKHFGLKLYKGKKFSEKNRITPEQALALEDEIDQIQVTVKVFTGDRFDLRNMTYNGKPRNQKT